MSLRRVSIVGGTNPSASSEQLETASGAGRLLAASGVTVLYEGTAQGPVGALVAAVQSAGGEAVSAPADELGSITDGFLALPGPPATLELLFALCLDAPRSEQKPIGLLNTSDYYTSLLTAVADAVVERFVLESQRGRLIVHRDPAELLQAMADFRPPETRRQTG